VLSGVQRQTVESPGSLLQRQEHGARRALLFPGGQCFAQPVVAAGQLAELRGPNLRRGRRALSPPVCGSHGSSNFRQRPAYPPGREHRHPECDHQCRDEGEEIGSLPLEPGPILQAPSRDPDIENPVGPHRAERHHDSPARVISSNQTNFRAPPAQGIKSQLIGRGAWSISAGSHRRHRSALEDVNRSLGLGESVPGPTFYRLGETLRISGRGSPHQERGESVGQGDRLQAEVLQPSSG
jgi:hypothetical protein